MVIMSVYMVLVAWHLMKLLNLRTKPWPEKCPEAPASRWFFIQKVVNNSA